MLYYLLPPLADSVAYLGVLNVTRYITFRTAAASITALLISLLLGPWMIAKLRDFQIGQVIRGAVSMNSAAIKSSSGSRSRRNSPKRRKRAIASSTPHTVRQPQCLHVNSQENTMSL